LEAWIACLTSMFRPWSMWKRKLSESNMLLLGFHAKSFIIACISQHCPLLTLFCQEMKFMRLLERPLLTCNAVTERLRGRAHGPLGSLSDPRTIGGGCSGPSTAGDATQPQPTIISSRCAPISNRQSWHHNRTTGGIWSFASQISDDYLTGHVLGNEPARKLLSS
jgi:hypothetical protein